MARFRILLWIALAIALGRLAFIELARREGAERLDRAARSRVARSARLPWDPGPGLRITQFYAREGEILSNQDGLICYGVNDAARVWIEPPVAELYPAFTRCFGVSPRRDTTYTLYAEDASGRRVSESFQIRVKPAPPEFRLFAVSGKSVRAGDPFVVCYGVEWANEVRLDPPGWNLPPSPKYCARFYPKSTATFTVTARGAGGTDRRSFPVAVQ